MMQQFLQIRELTADPSLEQCQYLKTQLDNQSKHTTVSISAVLISKKTNIFSFY